VARYFAASSHSGVLLNFDERPNLCLVADCASIEIDELSQLDIFPELHVWGHTGVLIAGV
jgi:hypothetical protein